MKHALFFSTLLSRPFAFMDAAGEGGTGGGTGTPAPGGSFFQGGDSGNGGQGGSPNTPPQGAGDQGAGTPPEGAPDWLIGKFATNNEAGEFDLNASMEKQAQGYSELFRSFSKKTDTLKAELKGEVATEYAANYAQERGVPEELSGYAYPDNVTAPAENVDGALRQWAKDNNVGAEQFQSLINDVWVKTFPDPAEESAKLGKTSEAVQERVDKINKWIGANIHEDHQGAISRVMQTADGVMFMEAVADMVNPSGFAPDLNDDAGKVELTRENIRALQSDPKFGQDEKYTAYVRGLWSKYASLPADKRQ